jgi:uncharacterized membrane protein YfcA
MTETLWILIPLLFLVSLVYSSVGLGGGSSYVAIFSLFGLPLARIPPIALFLNIIVATIALIRFKNRGYLKLNLVMPLLIGSIPATYLGARWQPDEKILSVIFAVVLFVVSLLLFSKSKEIKTRFTLNTQSFWLLSFALGGALGYLAGVMGIGGGIFLGPILLLIGFSSPRHIAGTCSAFVLVNSSVGLFSHFLRGNVEFSSLLFLGVAVFVGGHIGAFLGSRKVSPVAIQRIMALLLFAVSVKLGMEIFI